MLLSILLIINACVEPVELVLDEPSRIVVLSQQFQANEPLHVLVAQSQALFQGNNTYVNNAVVTVFKDGEEKGRLNYELDSNGIYGTNDDFKPLTGATYKITVDAPNLNSITAESRVPEPVRIRNLQVLRLVEQQNAPDETELNFKVRVVLDDPPGENNYYHLNFAQSVFEFVVIGRDTIPLPFPFPASATIVSNNANNTFTNHPEGGLMIHDQAFDGELKTLSFDSNIKYDSSTKVLGKLEVELRSITEDYYLFFKSLQRQSLSTNNSNLTAFDDPTDVHSNVENGYGIFAGYSNTFESVKVK